MARCKTAAHAGTACAFPSEASTLHRLLGAQPGSQRLRYHAGNPLHLDVLVVDEASMIDLTMMSRLIDALPPHARVIFWAIVTSLPRWKPGPYWAISARMRVLGIPRNVLRS